MTLGTLDGLIGNIFLFFPGITILAGIFYLSRKGFFGPNQ